MVPSVGRGTAGNNFVNTPITTGGAASSSGGNLLSDQKDAKEASTDPQFGDVWKKIQSDSDAKKALNKYFESLDQDVAKAREQMAILLLDATGAATLLMQKILCVA